MKRYIKAAVISFENTPMSVKEHMASDPTTRPEILMELAGHTYYSHPMVAALTSNLKCPAEVLDRMLEVVGDDTWAIGEILKHPNLSEASLSRVAMSRNRRIREEIFENLDVVPVEILQLLSDDDAPEIRSYVAQASNTPSETLAKMSNDPSSLVKFWVAQNPNTPADVVNSLADSFDDIGGINDFDTQEAIARNPKTPSEVLAKLAKTSKSYTALCLIAANPNTPPDILASMANGSCQSRVAANPNTSPEVLDQLSKVRDQYVRRMVAANPSASAATLKRLSNSRDWRTLDAVLSNPSTPYTVLQRFVNDEDYRSTVMHNPAWTNR